VVEELGRQPDGMVEDVVAEPFRPEVVAVGEITGSVGA